MTYANGETRKATHNRLGQMIAEKWYSGTSSLTTHYQYVYDGSGISYGALTFCRRKNILTCMNRGGSPGQVMEYGYSRQENESGNPVSSFRMDGRTIVSHSKVDRFGRKAFDELQMGKGFLSRPFHYHEGTPLEMALKRGTRLLAALPCSNNIQKLVGSKKNEKSRRARFFTCNNTMVVNYDDLIQNNEVFIRYAFRNSDCFSLIHQYKRVTINSKVDYVDDEFVDLLLPYFVKQHFTGDVKIHSYIPKKCVLNKYKCCKDTLGILLSQNNVFEDKLDLIEDICFYINHTLWFESISHEREAKIYHASNDDMTFMEKYRIRYYE